MEQLFNFIIIFVMVVLVIFRVKKNIQSLDKIQTFGNRQFNLPQLALINNKDIDKLVKVYGPGAMLSVDEVTALLGVSAQTAQNYLDQMVSSGKANQVPSSGGKIRYKIQ